MLADAGLTTAQLDELVEAESLGVLSAELRRLEADGHTVEELLRSVAKAGRLDDIEDLGSLLAYRITKLAAHYQPTAPPRAGMIVGLIPRAGGTMNPDDQLALTEREHLIEQRTHALVDRARVGHEPWIDQLPEPTNAAGTEALAVVAAYRERWKITSAASLGPVPDDNAQLLDYQRAKTRLDHLQPGQDDDPVIAAPSRSTERDQPRR